MRSLKRRIPSGSEYAQFKTSDTTYSNSTQFYIGDNGNQFILVGTGVRPVFGSSATVVIRAEGFGIIKDITLTVGSESQPYDFQMYTYPSDIESGFGSATIFVDEHDSTGGIISCDPYRLITLSVDNPQFGSFRDTAGNNVVNNVTSYYKDVKEGRVQYFADGAITCTNAIITLTASSPGMISGSTLLNIRPPDPCLSVTMSPDTISPGDTVSIMIKKSGYCNAEEDYPSGHIFNAQIVEGGEYGKWLSNDGRLWEYIICDSLGFKFIATDTLSQNSVNVLFVFYPECAVAATNVLLENGGISEREVIVSSTADKQKTINKKMLPKRKPLSESCQANRSVTIEKDDCNYAPICASQPNPPLILTLENTNNFANYDICATQDALGGFKAPDFDSETHQFYSGSSECMENPFNIDPCIDENGWVRFSISPISINVILDYCLSGLRGIDDVEPIYIPDADVCCALEDLERYKTYPVAVRQNAYALNPVIYAHEMIHKQQYEQIIQNYKSDFDKYFQFGISCSKYTNLDEAQAAGRQLVWDALNELMQKVTFDWNKLTKADGTDEEKLAYERSVHKQAQAELKPFIEKLEKRKPINGCSQTTCY